MDCRVLLALLIGILGGAPPASASDEQHVDAVPARLILGGGVAALGASDGAGAIGSLGIGLEAGQADASRFLLIAEGLLGEDTSKLVDLFLGGAAGFRVGNWRVAPYFLGGFGYLARGMPDEAGNEATAFTAEGGVIVPIGREPPDRTELWVGIRAFVPAVQGSSYSQVAGSPPRLPAISLNFRIWGKGS